MKLTKMGFGFTKYLGNYENLRIYLEVDLEPGEDVDIALDVLRTRAAEEVDFGDDYRDLRTKIAIKKLELACLISSVESSKLDLEIAINKWDNLVEYFSASNLTDIGSIVTGIEITSQINFDEIDNDDSDDDEHIFSEF